MSLKRALKTLMGLGLTEMDSQVYTYLAKKGPHGEKELSHSLNCTELDLALSLKNLQGKGFITSMSEPQIIFVAIPLEKVIEEAIRKKIQETQLMKKEKENFLSNSNQQLQ